MKLGDNFCVMPWVHLHVHPTGEVKTCCIGKDTVGNCKTAELKEVWNSNELKQLRLDFLNNKINDNCAICINHEKNKIHSLRQSLNSTFENEIPSLVDKTNTDGSCDEFKLKYLDIRFSNFCNFKCRTCFGESSSAIFNEDLKESGSTSEMIIYPGKSESDILEQVLPHIEFVQKIYFAGGEPLIQREHWDILDKLIELGRTDVELFYNTNLSTLKFKDKHLVDYWKHFTNVIVSASIDGWKAPAEYWRSGTKWDVIENNIKTIRSKTPHIKLGTTTTIGWPNLWNALDFLDHCIDTNLIDPMLLRTNVLTAPGLYSLSSLPEFKKILAKKRITQTVDKLNEPIAMLHSDLLGLINFIDSSSTTKSLKNFTKFNGRLDRLRGEDFFETFPEHIDMKPYLQ